MTMDVHEEENLSFDLSKSCAFTSKDLDNIEETARIALIKVTCIRNTIGYFLSDLKSRLTKEGYVNVSVQETFCRYKHKTKISTANMKVDFSLIVEADIGNEKCKVYFTGPQLFATYSRNKKLYNANLKWSWNTYYQNVQLDGRSTCYDSEEGRELAKTLKPMVYNLSKPIDYERNMTHVLILIRNYFDNVAIHGKKVANDDEHLKDYAQRCRLQIENEDRKDEIRRSGKKFS